MPLNRATALATAILLASLVLNLRADTVVNASAENGSSPSSTFGVLDLTTGAFSPIATLSNIFVEDLALAPDGSLYALTTPFSGPGSAEFGTIDPNTGAIKDIAADSAGLESMGFSGDGSLYTVTYSASGPDELYTILPSTGAETLVTDISGSLSNDTAQLRFIGDTAYATSNETPSELDVIDLTSGVATSIGSTGLNALNGLGAVVSGRFADIAVTGDGAQIFSIDPATGIATPWPATNDEFVFTAEATPEPASTLLICLGLTAIYLRKRRSAI